MEPVQAFWQNQKKEKRQNKSPGKSPGADRYLREVKKTKVKSTSRIFDAIITLSVLAIFFGLPVFFTASTIQGIAFEKQIYFYFWILLGFVAWVSKGVSVGHLRIIQTPFDVLILIFLFVYGLSAVFSVDKWHSFWGFFGDPSRGFLNILALVCAYYLLNSFLNPTRLRWVFGSILCSGLVVSLWAFFGLVGIQFLPENLAARSPLSLIGSLSNLTIFLQAMLPLLVIAIFKIKQEEEETMFFDRILILLIVSNIVLNMFVLFKLSSFVSWMGAFVGMGFFMVYIFSQIVRSPKGWNWLPMFVFVGILFSLMMGSDFTKEINLPIEISPSKGLSWEVVKNSAKENFILGSGPGTYGYNFSMFRPKEFNQNDFFGLRFYQGKGVFFEGFPTIGALGILAMLLLTISFVSVCVYLISQNRKKNKIYSLGVLSATIILFVNSFLVRIDGSILIFGTLLAALCVFTLSMESGAEQKPIKLSLKAAPKFALALAFLFMVTSAAVASLFVFMGKAYLADAQMKSAIENEDLVSSQRAELMLEATVLNPKEGRYFTRLGQEYMVLANNEALKFESQRDLELIRQHLTNSLSAAKKGSDLMPSDALATEALAQVYESASLYVKKSLDEAEKQYERAIELEPHNPSFLVKLGQIKVSKAASTQDGEEKDQLTKQAGELFEKAIEEKDDFAAAHFNLSLIREVFEDKDGAIESMSRAAQISPSDSNFLFNLGRLHRTRGEKEDLVLAEMIFRRMIAAEIDEANARFNLALTLEAKGEKDLAIEQHQEVLDMLSENQEDEREKIVDMVQNLQRDIPNDFLNIGASRELSVPKTSPIQPSSLEAPSQSQPTLILPENQTITDQ